MGTRSGVAPRARVRVELRPSRRSVAIGIGLVVLAAGAYAAARETSTFAVRGIAVSGATPAVRAQVERALAPLIGTSLLALNGPALEGRVDALPTVISSSYDRAFPHTLRVAIVPEQPAAVLHRGRETWLVSARARVIARIPKGRRLDLARIWVPTATPVEVGGFLAPDQGGAAARAAALAASFPARIATVAFTHGELTFDLRSGLELRLGEPVDIRLKLAVARRALPLLPSGTAYLDVAVPGRPVAGPNSQLSGKA